MYPLQIDLAITSSSRPAGTQLEPVVALPRLARLLLGLPSHLLGLVELRGQPADLVAGVLECLLRVGQLPVELLDRCLGALGGLHRRLELGLGLGLAFRFLALGLLPGLPLGRGLLLGLLDLDLTGLGPPVL